ncbi:MAG: Rrf2 family transcriptional regulator [Lachnospiraceae bacterium]|nr:Rrf2 family transcriptional regulator [Lachnospiraceae bacterium]
MLLTRESDYAVRIVRALKNGEKQPVKNICAEEDIPEPFTYKILKKLEKAGIVKAIRGAQGGYYLSRKINELTLEDIVMAIDSDLAITQCTTKNCECIRNEILAPCTVHNELQRIQEILIKELKSKTLAEIL